MKPRLNLFLGACLAATAIVPSLRADILYWKGNAAATEWTTAGAWTTDQAGTTVSGAAPTAADSAIFSSDTATGAQVITLAADRAALGLSFVNAGTKTFQSTNTTNRTLAIGSGGVQVALVSGDVTFAATAPVSLAADQTWTINADGSNPRIVNVNGALSGTGNLTKDGAGSLLLSGTNTFSGALNLNAGILVVNSAGALGGTSNPLNIAAGTTLRTTVVAGVTVSNAKPININGNFAYTFGGTNAVGNLHMGTGNVTLGTNATIDSTAGTLTFGGPVGGGFGIVRTGGGTLALLGANTYTGLTDVRTSSNIRFNGTSGFSNTNVYLNGGSLDLGGPVVEENAIVLGTGPGQIRFRDNATNVASTSAHGGLSSASGYRKISLTSAGVPNAPLVWGNTEFSVGTPHFISGAYATGTGIFLLSTPQAAGTVELTNDIDLSQRDRRFSVRDGATTGGMPDAVLSGKLTNGGISLQGGGTLLLTNPGNSFTLPTVITNGHNLRVPSIASVLGTSNIILDGGLLEVGDETPIVIGLNPGEVSFGAAGGGVSSYGTNKTLSFGGESNPLVWGSSGFLEAGGNLLLSNTATENTTTLANPIDLNGANRTVDVRNGAAAIDAALSGVISSTAGGLTLIGGGALLLANEANSYVGPTTLSAGSIVVTKIADGGATSPIGTSSNAASNLVLNGGGIRYIGAGNTTDRLFTVSASAALNASGTGPLVFSNSGPSATYVTTPSTGTTTISITGISQATNELRGNLTNGTGTNVVAINKLGRTKWSLAGTNLYTGATDINAGELILDYSFGGIPANPAAAGIFRMDASDLTVKGKAAGTTSATINSVRFGITLGIANTLKVDANGGAGVALTINTLNSNSTAGNTQVSNLIDISSSAANSVTIGALSGFNTATHATPVSRNVLMSNTATDSGRSNTIVLDSTGYGFATLSNPTNGTLGRLTLADMEPLTAANGANNQSFKLTLAETTGGTLTRTAALPYGTLTIDSTGGPITLDMAGFTLGNATNSNGRGILVTGDQPVTITGTTAPAYSPFVYNYGSSTLTYNLPMSGQSLITGGTGLISHTGPISGSTAIYANGSVLRFAGSNQTLVGNSALYASNGGVIEIATDLNGAADGDFTSALGSGTGNVRLFGESGVSSAGGTRVVNFGGAVPATTLTWGAGSFLVSPGGADADVGFKLGSPFSDSTVDILNPILLGARDRVFVVANGSAETDAILRGVLSGPGAGIVKRGAGTLVLDGANTYSGNTDVFEGTLRLTQAALNDQAAVRIATGAKLELAHGLTDTVDALYINGVAQPDGIYGAADLPASLSGTGKLNVGGVPVGGSAYDAWVTANTLPAEKDAPEEDADDDGLRNLLEYAVGSQPKSPGGSVLAKASGTSGAVTFNRAAGRTDINSVLESSPDLIPGLWTVIATSTAGGAFVTNDANVIVTDANNPSGLSAVSVTDNRTPLPAKRFYRLRVTK